MGITEPKEQKQVHFCFLCNGPGSTKHHLWPKSVCHEARGNTFIWRATVRACMRCHGEIHYYFSHWELAYRFNSEERIRVELKKRKEWRLAPKSGRQEAGI